MIVCIEKVISLEGQIITKELHKRVNAVTILKRVADPESES